MILRWCTLEWAWQRGASTTIGAEAAARSPADGYTVLMIDSTTLEDPEVSGNLRKVGLDEVGGWTPAQMADQMQTDLQKWGEIIRAANIRLDS